MGEGGRRGEIIVSLLPLKMSVMGNSTRMSIFLFQPNILGTKNARRNFFATLENVASHFLSAIAIM